MAIKPAESGYVAISSQWMGDYRYWAGVGCSGKMSLRSTFSSLSFRPLEIADRISPTWRGDEVWSRLVGLKVQGRELKNLTALECTGLGVPMRRFYCGTIVDILYTKNHHVRGQQDGKASIAREPGRADR